MSDPEEIIRTATLRPASHDPVDVGAAVSEQLASLRPDPERYFLRSLTVKTATRDGKPKGRRYELKCWFAPWPAGHQLTMPSEGSD